MRTGGSSCLRWRGRLGSWLIGSPEELHKNPCHDVALNAVVEGVDMDSA